jgi:hypothetical protein
MVERGNKSDVVAREEWEKCSQDPLYYVNTYGWTYNPRLTDSNPIVPFNTYRAFQDQMLVDILSHISSKKDLMMLKSRDMGVSWVCVVALEWLWHFSSKQLSFLMGSSKESLVDDPGNPKALFVKIDQFHQWQPEWLLPGTRKNITKERMKDPNRSFLKLINSETGSIINGESTNVNFGRGDRRTAIFFDEFATVEHGGRIESGITATTDCKLINSTPIGMGNHFAKLWHDPKRSITKKKYHWTMHPEKNWGMYKASMSEGRIKVELLSDPVPPDDYEYIPDGRTRSPWYDEECTRDTPRGIAQEQDCDFSGSGGQFFDPKIISDHMPATRPPVYMGEFVYETRVPYFQSNTRGRLRMWCPLDKSRKDMPPRSTYGIGVDVAAGTGGSLASNSVLCVMDLLLGEQVAEFATPDMLPMQLAEYAMELGIWFRDGSKPATMIWEHQGPGGQFGRVLIESGYRSMYERTPKRDPNKRPNIWREKKPGFHTNRESKRQLLSEFQRGISQGLITIKSDLCLNEMCDYVDRGGKIFHTASDGKIADPSGAGENHGDRVIAAALVSLLAMERNNGDHKRDAGGKRVSSLNPPHGSPAWLRRQVTQQGDRDSW